MDHHLMQHRALSRLKNLFGKMLRYFNVNDVVIRAKSQFNTNCRTDLSIRAFSNNEHTQYVN